MEVCKLCVTKTGDTYDIQYPPEPLRVDPTTVKQFSYLEKCQLLHRLWKQGLAKRGGPSKLSSSGSESDFSIVEIQKLWSSTTTECDKVLKQLENKQSMTLEEAISIFSELYSSEMDFKLDLSRLSKELHDKCNKPSRNSQIILENISGLWQFVQLSTNSAAVVEFLQMFHEKLKLTGKIHPLVKLAAPQVRYWIN